MGKKALITGITGQDGSSPATGTNLRLLQLNVQSGLFN